jgi:hypothetical protein
MRDTEDIPVFNERPAYSRSISPPLFPRLKRGTDGLAELSLLKSQMPIAEYPMEPNEVEDDSMATMKLIEGWCEFSSCSRRLGGC